MISRKNLNEFLHNLLATITPQTVIALEQELTAAANPNSIFEEFETSGQLAPHRDAMLLEQWAHYSWLKTELNFLGNQKVTSLEKEANPEFLDSIDNLVREEKERGVTLLNSLAVLEQFCLQLITTEHPTDPLSQEARDLLSQLATQIDKCKSSSADLDATAIKELLAKLMAADPIPKSTRDVEVEVNRDIRMGSNPLYDTLPDLIHTVLSAYRKHYSQKEFSAAEDRIWVALQKIVRDATWAGFDGDNNANVTPLAMRNAIRIRHVRAVEKHSDFLTRFVISTAKEIERDLRSKLFDTFSSMEQTLHLLALDNLSLIRHDFTTVQLDTSEDFDDRVVPGDANITKSISAQSWIGDIFQPFKNQANKAVSDRNFEMLVKLFDGYSEFNHKSSNRFLRGFTMTTLEGNKFLAHLQQQRQRAQQLVKLTAFSGAFRDNTKGAMTCGALQEFYNLFDHYKNDIREQTNLIEIENTNPSDFILAYFNKLMREHAGILSELPQLKDAMNTFGVLLHSYGMSFGRAHVRQDSSVFIRVWNAIVEDLLKRPELKHNLLLHSPRTTQFFQQLLEGGDESAKIFSAIYHSLDYYRTSPEFCLIISELERLELALIHHDMFEDIIISNAESSTHIFAVLALLKVFPKSSQHLTVVPLLEKREDLENYKLILEKYIQWRICQVLPEEMSQELKDASTETFLQITSQHRHLFKDLEIEIMLGFSDTERVSGLTALLSVEKAQEDFIRLTQQYHVRAKLFHGPGADLLRGGSHLHKQKMTIQGNGRNNLFGTRNAAISYRESQFVMAYRSVKDPQIEIYSFTPQIQQQLVDFCQRGAIYFEDFHDTSKGYGHLTSLLFGWGANWIVNILNSSSRASKRDGSKQTKVDRTISVQTGGTPQDNFVLPDKLRAITYTQINEMLRMYFHIIIGPGHAMRNMDKKAIYHLYHLSPTFRDIYEKTAYGLSLTNVDIAAAAYFKDRPDLRPSSPEERLEWASEAINDRGKFTEFEIRKHLQSPEGTEFMLQRLARFFAYVEHEYHITKEFIFDVNKNYLHKEAYDAYSTMASAEPVSLLHHFPVWREQIADLCQQSDLLSIMMSRLNFHVARRHKLDEIYGVTIDTKVAGSQLSYVARLIGSVGAAITAFRYMVFPEHLHAQPRYGIENAVNTRTHVTTLYSKNIAATDAKLNKMLWTRFNLFKQARDGVLQHNEEKNSAPALSSSMRV
jgi:hypothetical protein